MLTGRSQMRIYTTGFYLYKILEKGNLIYRDRIIPRDKRGKNEFFWADG